MKYLINKNTYECYFPEQTDPNGVTVGSAVILEAKDSNGECMVVTRWGQKDIVMKDDLLPFEIDTSKL